jgi:hypothetical protein
MSDNTTAQEKYEQIECKDCGWSRQSKDRLSILKSGFYHVIGQGHDVTRQDEIEEEFNL